jgi:hypothetical protein
MAEGDTEAKLAVKAERLIESARKRLVAGQVAAVPRLDFVLTV